MATLTVRNPSDAITLNETPQVTTHSGVFHADDVLAVAVLALAWGRVEVTRTRDRALLEAAVADSSVIVVDVGGAYDPDKGVYDHHQREGKPEPRPNGTPYAASGLVWKHHGFRAVRNVLKEATGGHHGFSQKDVLEVQHELDKFMSCVDALDNGYTRPCSMEGKPQAWGRANVSAILSMANPLAFFGETDFDGHFVEAVQMTIPVLRRLILAEASKLGLASEVRGAIKAAKDSGKSYFVLSCGMPAPTWVNIAALEPDSILYAVFPMASGGYGVQQVPVKPGSFEGRKPLPEAWAGLRAEAFQAVLPSSIPSGAVFCHPGKFICGHSTLEGACAIADLAANS